MGYVGRTNGRDLHSQKDAPLFVCGVQKNDKTDVRLMDRRLTLVLVQGDIDPRDPHP